jgi:flagellar hook assembly protein FlgD
MPNPTARSVTIEYSLPQVYPVEIRVYDASGRCQKTLIMNSSRVMWDLTDHHGAQVSAGVYFVEMETETGLVTRKLVLLK